ncbi:TrkA family potassium uptake protein [Candidatus Poribacteria bacterium]|nr:TrkA family potassium uptake protein [Candidatus Poribacteria bacterium]
MNVIIAGSGRVGSDIGKMLSMQGHNVVMIDINPDAFKKLGSAFNGLQIIGSGTDEISLKEANIESADIFIALTNKDNINIMAAQVAKTIFNVPKVIAKVDDPDREKVFQGQDFKMVSGTHLITSSIVNGIVKKPYKRHNTVSPDYQIVCFIAKEEMIGKQINQVNIANDFMICSIIHNGNMELALPTHKINSGDELVAIIKNSLLDKLDKMLSV